LRSIYGTNQLLWALPIKPDLKANYLENLYSYTELLNYKRENKTFRENEFANNSEYLKYKIY